VSKSLLCHFCEAEKEPFSIGKPSNIKAKKGEWGRRVAFRTKWELSNLWFQHHFEPGQKGEKKSVLKGGGGVRKNFLGSV